MRRTFVPVLLLASVCLTTLGSVASAQAPQKTPANQEVTLDPKLRVHPLLQFGAQVEPDRVVRLLVQKTSAAADSKAIARAAGNAKIREEFPFIRTIVLDVPQKVALSLAKNPNVRYITFDAPVRRHNVDTANLKTTYPGSLGLDQVWNGGAQATGAGVTVALIDSGVNSQHTSLQQVTTVVANDRATTSGDLVGHGTHVAGIIAGKDPQGRYIGVAPNANLISVRVAADNGDTYESDVIRGIQWVYENRSAQNIKVVNLSTTSSVAESYMDSPLAAAVERLWFSGVTVVVSAGNDGSNSDATWYPPANDPFVITVGALDTNETIDSADDTLAPFSSRGQTQDGFAKPDVVAPGRRIVAPFAGPNSQLGQQFPDRVVDTDFIRLSGTSMAAPMVTGSVTLLLETKPNLSPDQIKWLITNSAKPYPGMTDNARALSPVNLLDLAASGTAQGANVGITKNPGADASGSSDTEWNQTYWAQTYWAQTYWAQTYWAQTYWAQTYWAITPVD